MRLASLWLRLFRGTARGGVLRLTALAVGVAAAIAAILLAFTVPHALHARDDALAARTPVIGATAEPGQFLVHVSVEQTGVGRLTRATVTGVRLDSPRPPGVGAWPRPGEALVSPAVAELPATSAVRHGLTIVGQIDEQGLTEPGELVIYEVSDAAAGEATSGEAADTGPDPGDPMPYVTTTGFGSRVGVPPENSLLLYAEVVLLIGLPALLFVVTALRLVTLRRERAAWALHLVGMAPAQRRRLQLIEAVAVMAVGAAVGTMLYAALQATVGRSGVLGVRWFPDTGRVGGATAAAVVLIVVALIYGSTRITRRAEDSRAEHHRVRVAGPLATALACGAGLAAAFLIGAGAFVLVRAPATTSNPLAWSTLAALTVLAVCAMGASRVLIHVAGRTIARWPRGASLRMGGTIAAHHAGSIALAATMLSVLVLGGALGSALLTTLRFAALGDQTTATVSVELTDLTTAERGALSAIDGDALISITDHAGEHYSRIVVADCPAVVAQEDIARDECREVPQGGAERSPEQPARVMIQRATGAPAVIPRPPRDERFPWDTKIPLTGNEWAWDASGAASVIYAAPLADGRFDALVAALHDIVPARDIQTSGIDEEQWNEYLQQSALLRSCLAVAIALTVGGILLSLLEVRHRQRRSWAACAALGMPGRRVRRATAATFGVAVFASAGAVAVAGTAGAVTLLKSDALGVDASVVAWSLAPAAIAVVVAAAVGYVLPPQRFDRALLQDY